VLALTGQVQTLPSSAAPGAPGAPGAPAGRVSGAAVVPAEDDLARAAAMINAARRPMIVIGHGAVAARIRLVVTSKAKASVCADVG
jgi:pyruvate oxidase